MLIPMELLRKVVDINVSDEEFVKNFSLKSAEVDSFSKLCEVKGLVVGKIISIKDHPDSNHLHITTVDMGDEVDDIVCGAPNVEVGRKVIVARVGVKLPGGEMKKAIIRGVPSNGMNCALDELGIDHKFQGYEGIYYLGDDAVLGSDPLEYLHLNDYVLEIELTPNRQDLLSIIGVAYDTKAICNSSMNLEKIVLEPIKEKADIKVSTETENCNAYYSKVIKDVEIKESPAWLKGSLMKMNIRPINNVVDITNYVLMLTGQPLHAFDYDDIKSKKIVVKMAKDGETFTTLDHQERLLSSSDIVITDGKTPLCLGGVMGGLNSEVKDTTKNIFLESASFNPQCIKQTSKRLGLQSESSLRFEKGINPELTKYALDLASKLLVELASGKVLSGGNFFDNRDLSTKEVKVSLRQINKVLGRKYTKDEVLSVFKGLSFDVEEVNGVFKVQIQKRRPDISTYQDLIEEVVRISGYDKISTTIPESHTNGKLSPYQSFVRKIRHSLSQNLNEVISYSLVSDALATDFDNEDYGLVKVMNPLVDDRTTMRHSLIPSLLQVVKYNQNRKNDDVFIYEIGRRYELDKETPILSIALSGTISSTLWKGEKEVVDFYYLKGLVESMFSALSVKNYRLELPNKELKGLHPGVSAQIVVGKDDVIGFMGKVHPDYLKKYEISDTYVCEIELDKLFNQAHPLKTVKAISKYPSIERDLAFVLDENITAEDVIKEIQKVAKRSLDSISVFDLYRGEKIGKDKKQIAFSLTFSDMNRTLETQEVDEIVNNIIKKLEEKGISLRS